jgi:hypothetical protein
MGELGSTTPEHNKATASPDSSKVTTNSTSAPPACYSFEEFRLMYESAERVTDRRLSGNKFNYSIGVGVVLAIAAVANWSISNPQYKYTGFTLILLLSVMGIIYVRLWHKQTLDFKALNTAKFRVLNEMAPLVRFKAGENIYDGGIVSFQPFDREWKILQELHALQRPAKRRAIALSSTDAELFIPNAFQAIFALTGLISLVAIIFHFDAFWKSWINMIL